MRLSKLERQIRCSFAFNFWDKPDSIIRAVTVIYLKICMLCNLQIDLSHKTKRYHENLVSGAFWSTLGNSNHNSAILRKCRKCWITKLKRLLNKFRIFIISFRARKNLGAWVVEYFFSSLSLSSILCIGEIDNILKMTHFIKSEGLYK